MDIQSDKNDVVVTMTKAEADKISDQLIKMASQLNRSALDFAYLTAGAVLSTENVFHQPKWFTELNAA